MRVRAYLSGNPVHDRVIRAFAEGCGAELRTFDQYEPSDVAVVFGIYKSRVPISWPRGEIFRRQRENNLDVVVLETGYINRGDGETHHYAAGFNGLNGRADFKAQGMPSDRAHKLRRHHGLRILRPRERGEHIVLCAQVPWDAAVDHLDYMKWLGDAADVLRATSRRVVFRPHPHARLNPIPGFDYSTEPLSVDLQNAHCVVACNSNACVEGLIEGIPAVATDKGSMVWDVASHYLEDFESPKIPTEDELEGWINDLSYKQWTIAEMKSGETWAHLSR